MAIGLVLSLFVPETLTRSSSPKRVFAEIKKSIGWLLSSYVSIYALYYAFGVITGILSLTLIDVLGIVREEAVSIAGLYIGLSTIISIVLFYFFGVLTDRRGPRIPTLIGFTSLAISQTILAFNLSLSSILASSIALGVAMGAIFVISTVVATSTSKGSRGTSVGIHQTMNILGVATGAPISGFILEIFGLQLPYLIGALVQFLALIIVLFSLRSYTKPLT
jgi:MFS family permease